MNEPQCRYFLSYSGIKLPLKLVSPLDKEDTENRNTFFRGYYDEKGTLLSCEKVVYGDVELEHRYQYYDSGVISKAEIIETGESETNIIEFDESGMPQR